MWNQSVLGLQAYTIKFLWLQKSNSIKKYIYNYCLCRRRATFMTLKARFLENQSICQIDWKNVRGSKVISGIPTSSHKCYQFPASNCFIRLITVVFLLIKLACCLCRFRLSINPHTLLLDFKHRPSVHLVQHILLFN